jgi:hypothetical protein
MGISPAEYHRRLQKVRKITTLRELVAEEVIKEEANLLELKKQDFEEGDIYGNGRTYTYQSQEYSDFKKTVNPLAKGKVDLILTGAFVNSMYLLKPKQGRYLFGAKDKKRNKLVEDYSINIMGLNQNVFEKFQRDIILPRFIRKLKQYAQIR